MKILFIRHGDPDYSIDSLTEVGKREAELLIPRVLKIPADEYYCSPLGRALDTAKPSMEALGKPFKVLDFLEEFPAHVYDINTGKRRIPWDLMPSYWTKDKDFYDTDKWIKTDIMQSGNVEEVYNRVCKQFDDFLAERGYVRNGNTYTVTRENTDTIVFFCHFGITSVLVSHLLGISPLVLWQGFVALPTSVTTVITEEREKGTAYFRCNGFGDISHLYAAGQEPSFSARFCEVYSNSDERH